MILFYLPIPFLLSNYPSPTVFHHITFQFEILTGNALLVFKYTDQIVLILASFLLLNYAFASIPGFSHLLFPPRKINCVG